MKATSDSSAKVVQRNANHYDFISDVWQLIYGDNFHAGYYYRADETYKEATENLTALMAKPGRFSRESKVLDVGCGIGGPAIYLHEKFGCFIHGISISEKGVALARDAARQKGYEARVAFSVADAKDNKLPDQSFDIVWGMESLHLMDDKPKVFAECYRVLKPGGQLLLCDNMSARPMSDAEILQYYKELRLLERVFGKTRTEPLSGYEAAARAAGFDQITCQDISQQTIPGTIGYYRKAVREKYDALVARSSKKYVDDFFAMCDAFLHFESLGFMSYGLLSAVKPHEPFEAGALTGD